jgi:hypothetical protein
MNRFIDRISSRATYILLFIAFTVDELGESSDLLSALPINSSWLTLRALLSTSITTVVLCKSSLGSEPSLRIHRSQD